LGSCSCYQKTLLNLNVVTSRCRNLHNSTTHHDTGVLQDTYFSRNTIQGIEMSLLAQSAPVGYDFDLSNLTPEI